ncbi:hypothetical protein C8J55DRAFT_188615 [Lentinula edodes]|uniref:Uncharacterized protein n=1 Tax=Lentinula lateritia TaxID=40482 RepID=A0A9W8ZYY7_9AGAR|nr:hypothetical protein C8J55DRAFT_188615 [Lentinula edodes]
MFRTTHAPTTTTTPHKLLCLLTVLSSLSFFLANALPIDLSISNSSSSSSPESLGIRTLTPENAKQANFLLGYTYENTMVGTDYNTATQITAAHNYEVGALGTIGKYLSPRPAQIHELKPGVTMECIVTAKKELLMRYRPVFVNAKSLKNLQTLEKYLTDHEFTSRSSILIARSPDTSPGTSPGTFRKGELTMFLPGIYIAGAMYDSTHLFPALSDLGIYVHCRPIQMMAHQAYTAIAPWEELQPWLWPKRLTTSSTLKYPTGH